MLHGAAKIASERARRRTRIRIIARGAVVAAMALMAVLMLLSNWFTFGFVWSSAPTPITSQNSPSQDTRMTVCVFAISSWKIRYGEQQVTGPSLVAIPLHWGSVSQRSGSLWTPPPGATSTKPNTTSVPFLMLFIPLIIASSTITSALAREQARANRGCCTTCGYNLKGIVPIYNQTTCPECGNIKKHRSKSAKADSDSLAKHT